MAKAGSLGGAKSKDSKSDFLLDVAARAFLEEGFAGASVGEIARRAKASKETFYSRYDSKNALFEAVIRRLVDRFSSQMDETMASQDPPETVLAEFSEKILQKILSDEGIALQKLINMESSRFPGLAKLFFEFGPQRIVRTLSRYMESQVVLKKLRPLDGEIAAQHFMAILTSDLMMRRSLGILAKRGAARHNAQRIKTTIDVFMRAYGSVESTERTNPAE